MHCHVIISVFSEKPEDEMNNYKKERKKMKKKVFAAFCAAAMFSLQQAVPEETRHLQNL